MDINDKIAARRREIEQEKRDAVAAELARATAERERQEAQQLEAVANKLAQERAVNQPYASKHMGKALSEVELEKALLNESIERVSKKELIAFVVLALISILNLVSQQIVHSVGWGVAALAYMAYVLLRNRKRIITQSTQKTP